MMYAYLCKKMHNARQIIYIRYGLALALSPITRDESGKDARKTGMLG